MSNAKDYKTCLMENTADKRSKSPRPIILVLREQLTIIFKEKGPLARCGKNKKTKPQSPDATGKFHFQRHTLREIYGQLTDGDDEVVCNVACWRNSDQYGAYLTVEISPKFVSFSARVEW